MNDFIFAGTNFGKENQITTPFEKGTGAELIFHFIHFFCYIFPNLLKGENVFANRCKRKSFIFKGLVDR
jgi:hypothetical protein